MSQPINTVVIYARSASANAYAIERQLAACREMATVNGWTVTSEYVDDGVSAISDRPTLDTILANADRVDAVVTYETSRIARDLAIIDQLDRAGVQVVTVA
jgi:site-specific DNA recombinase